MLVNFNLLFLIAFSFILAGVGYAYIGLSRRARRVWQESQVVRTELEKLRQINHELQNENKTLKTQLQHTLEDTVTHLAGWEFFQDRIQQQLNESKRYQLTMGLMMVDIDDFNAVNEAMGRAVADSLLQELAARLKSCVRQVDSISRLSKDTFVILLAQLAKPETAAIVGQRILQVLSKPFKIGEREIFITVSIGVSLYPLDGQTVSTLLKNAEQALHAAKYQGKHLCRFYQESMSQQSQRHLILYNSLNRETFLEELAVYFQPIIDVNNQSIWCMEAKLFWQHPELGEVNTEELLQYAEKQHKLNTLSLWLLKQACEQFLNWRKVHFKPGLLTVPLSLKHLENGGFVYQISHLLQELAFDPEWLLFEMKEGYLRGSIEIVEKALNMLHYLGVQVAIDDFGSGSFTLRYLNNVNVHYLKLDSSLTHDIVENEQTQSLVQSILSLANTLKMQVVVKDVNNRQQMEILKNLGCIFQQGPLFGMPVLGTDVIKKVVLPMA